MGLLLTSKLDGGEDPFLMDFAKCTVKVGPPYPVVVGVFRLLAGVLTIAENTSVHVICVAVLFLLSH